MHESEDFPVLLFYPFRLLIFDRNKIFLPTSKNFALPDRKMRIYYME